MALVDFCLLFVKSFSAIDEVVLASTSMSHCICHGKHYDVVCTYGLHLCYCQICDSVSYMVIGSVKRFLMAFMRA